MNDLDTRLRDLAKTLPGNEIIAYFNGTKWMLWTAMQAPSTIEVHNEVSEAATLEDALLIAEI